MTDKPGFNKGGMVTLGDERHQGLNASAVAELRAAWLSRGEFTQKAADVARHGPDLMAKLNSIERPKMTLVIGNERHEGLTVDPDILARLENVARHSPINEAFSKITTTPTTSWTDDAQAEMHLLGMNLHNLSFEVAEISDLDRRRPCLSEILEGYANRIDELMKRAPEAVT